jgi:hypothetical protein
MLYASLENICFRGCLCFVARKTGVDSAQFSRAGVQGGRKCDRYPRAGVKVGVDLDRSLRAGVKVSFDLDRSLRAGVKASVDRDQRFPAIKNPKFI